MTEYRLSVLFDLHGTLVDSLYQHVAACQHGCTPPASSFSCGAFIGRIAISGGLFAEMLRREGLGLHSAATLRMSTGQSLDEPEVRVAALRG